MEKLNISPNPFRAPLISQKPTFGYCKGWLMLKTGDFVKQVDLSVKETKITEDLFRYLFKK